jgi:nicotinamidase-related amidase
MAALWTEMCLAMPTIHALGEGYDVYIVTDASDGVSAEAHDMAVRRMVQAGAVPITWIGLSGEWQRDWTRESTLPDTIKIVTEHGGGSGVAFAWETQLLGASKPSPSTSPLHLDLTIEPFNRADGIRRDAKAVE